MLINFTISEGKKKAPLALGERGFISLFEINCLVLEADSEADNAGVQDLVQFEIGSIGRGVAAGNVVGAVVLVVASVVPVEVEQVEDVGHQVDAAVVSGAHNLLDPQVHVHEVFQAKLSECLQVVPGSGVAGVGVVDRVGQVHGPGDDVSFTRVKGEGGVEVEGELVESAEFEHPAWENVHVDLSATSAHDLRVDVAVGGPQLGGIEVAVVTEVHCLQLVGGRTIQHPLVGKPLVETDLDGGVVL